MPFRPAQKLLITICTAFPFALAKGGKGGEDGGNGTAKLSLAPLPAAAFAFYVISAAFTAYQALQAITNIYKRLFRRSSSDTLPVYTVGAIFRVSLLLSTLTLLIFNILAAISTAVQNNRNVPLPAEESPYPLSFFIAERLMEYLTDVFLILSAFALLAHRENVLVATPSMIRGIKIFFDAALTASLLCLGIARTGLNSLSSGMARTGVDPPSLRLLGPQLLDNIYVAFLALFLVAGVDILISSVILHIRVKHNFGYDLGMCLVVFSMALFVSPFFILYTVSKIVLWNINATSSLVIEQVDVASAVITFVLRYAIISQYLSFGKPPVLKEGGGLDYYPPSFIDPMIYTY